MKILKTSMLIVLGVSIGVIITISATHSKSEAEQILDDFYGMPDLAKWLSQEHKRFFNNGKAHFVFYYQPCLSCRHTNILTWMAGNLEKEKMPIIVLHPSHDQNDIDNLKGQLEMDGPVIVADRRFEKIWNKRYSNQKYNGLLYTINDSGEMVKQLHLMTVEDSDQLLNYFNE